VGGAPDHSVDRVADHEGRPRRLCISESKRLRDYVASQPLCVSPSRPVSARVRVLKNAKHREPLRVEVAGHHANGLDGPGNEYAPDMLCKQEVVGRPDRSINLA
jgi:hypothetical protein